MNPSELYCGLEESGKEGLPIKRVEYFLFTFRFCAIIENVISEGGEPIEEMKAIEKLCEMGAKKFGNHALYYYYWLHLIKAGKEEDLQRSQRLAEAHPELFDHLFKDILSQSKSGKSHGVASGAFVINNVVEFCDKILRSMPKLDSVNKGKVLSYHALSHWNSGLKIKFVLGLCVI